MSREAIVAAARGWIGTPYLHQASLKGVGCDCLGLLRGVWRETVGPEPEPVPPYAQDWPLARRDETLLAAALRHLTPRPVAELSPGDALVFRWRDHLPASHLAIAAPGARMIHAHDGACVAEVPLTDAWRRRLAGVFAFPRRDA
ncbi:MAG: C40 family peptidase [Methylobacteriaceae bacterium]|nr:C40 family peptidase [Methylobacteriaceae bacterium]